MSEDQKAEAKIEAFLKKLEKTPAGRILRSANPSLPALNTAKAEDIAHLIKEERTQVAASILALIPAKKAAETLRHLESSSWKIDLLQTVSQLEAMPMDKIHELNDSLQSRVDSIKDSKLKIKGGAPLVAKVLTRLPSAQRNDLTEKLTRKDPKVIETLKGHLFAFEDLEKLNDDDFKKIVDAIDQATWILAMKTAPQGLMDKMLGTMSERAQEMFLDEVENLGRLPRSKVEAAQLSIVEKALELEESGKVDLFGNNPMV